MSYDPLRHNIARPAHDDWPTSIEVIAHYEDGDRIMLIPGGQFFGTDPRFGSPMSGEALVAAITRLCRR